MSNETTLARIALARQNEEVVIAEASRSGQVFFTWMRIILTVTLAVSQAVVHHADVSGPNLLLPLSAGLYLALNGVILWRLITIKGRVRPAGAIAAQVGRAVFDYGFLTFEGWIAAQDASRSQHDYVNGVIIWALYLVFASASYNGWVIGWNLICAFGAVFFSIWVDHLHIPTSVLTFVCACYLVLGLTSIGLSNYIRKMFVDLRKRDNLSRFLAPQVAEHVMNLGDMALAPTQREVTVLFSDIRDFTALSEKLPPEEVLSMLDEYFGHMGQIVKGRDGIVNKFIGDGMLAFWNVPDRDEHHALHAIQAALDMQKKLAELNQHRAVLGKPALRIGVGVHTGVVAAGMLGGADQHEYTVIGDAVNVASRVEGLTKNLKCAILVTESTWALLNGKYAGRRVAEERVKGREQPVVVYALEADAPRAEAKESA